jgi:hypothetical protein
VQTDIAAERQQRLEQGLCTRCGAPALDGAELCREHLVDKRRRDARWRSDQRAARQAAGFCVWCPSSGPPARVKSGETSCLPCRVRRRRLPRAVEGVDKGVDKEQRIAAATCKHGDGRRRYHGTGRRGQQPAARLNLQDARRAQERFEAFQAGVTLLTSDEAKTWTRGQRERVEKATASCGESASRHIDDVLERLGHFQVRHGKRDGE